MFQDDGIAEDPGGITAYGKIIRLANSQQTVHIRKP